MAEFFGSSRDDDGDDKADEWLMTYADTITLLMCFFVLLFSISKMDHAKYVEVMTSIGDALGHDMQVESPGDRHFNGVLNAFNAIFEELERDGQASLGRTPRGIKLEISSSHMFASGAAELSPQILPMLEQVAMAIQDIDLARYVVEVEGHTDDMAMPPGGRYPSNWDLSTARATGVVRFLEGAGVEHGNLKASGYADTRPKLRNRDESGAPIPENQAQNRRVVIKVERPE